MLLTCTCRLLIPPSHTTTTYIHNTSPTASSLFLVLCVLLFRRPCFFHHRLSGPPSLFPAPRSFFGQTDPLGSFILENHPYASTIALFAPVSTDESRIGSLATHSYSRPPIGACLGAGNLQVRSSISFGARLDTDHHLAPGHAKVYDNERLYECILAAVIRSLRTTHTLNEKATRDSRNHGGRSATRAA